MASTPDWPSNPDRPSPDLAAMLSDLRTLTEIESPSTDMVAIGRVMDVVEGWARELGAECHALPAAPGSFSSGPGVSARPCSCWRTPTRFGRWAA